MTIQYQNRIIKNTSRYKVLAANYTPIVLFGLTNLINQQTDFEVCDTESNSADIFQAAIEYRPDIILTGLTYGNGNGLSLIERLVRRFPDLPILVFSLCDELFFAERCLNEGARGYIEMSASVEKVVFAMRTIIKGNTYVSEKMAEILLSKFNHTRSRVDNSPIHCFSNRELEVFQCMGRGSTPREIAEELNMSVKTVSTHVNRIKKKMDLNSTREVLLHALHWITDSDHKPG